MSLATCSLLRQSRSHMLAYRSKLVIKQLNSLVPTYNQLPGLICYQNLSTFSYILYIYIYSFQDVATEIILTLGQAFEIAYQMLLKSQSSQRPSVALDSNSRHGDSALSSLSDDTKLQLLLCYDCSQSLHSGIQESKSMAGFYLLRMVGQVHWSPIIVMCTIYVHLENVPFGCEDLFQLQVCEVVLVSCTLNNSKQKMQDSDWLHVYE